MCRGYLCPILGHGVTDGSVAAGPEGRNASKGLAYFQKTGPGSPTIHGPVSLDERGCASQGLHLARTRLSLENFAASALGRRMAEVLLGRHSQGLLIATVDGTAMVVPWSGADWTSSRPPRAASRAVTFRRPEPSGVWRRLIWQQRPRASARSARAENATRSARRTGVPNRAHRPRPAHRRAPLRSRGARHHQPRPGTRRHPGGHRHRRPRWRCRSRPGRRQRGRPGTPCCRAEPGSCPGPSPTRPPRHRRSPPAAGG
jgi:hypothetical protein